MNHGDSAIPVVDKTVPLEKSLGVRTVLFWNAEHMKMTLMSTIQRIDAIDVQISIWI